MPTRTQPRLSYRAMAGARLASPSRTGRSPRDRLGGCGVQEQLADPFTGSCGNTNRQILRRAELPFRAAPLAAALLTQRPGRRLGQPFRRRWPRRVLRVLVPACRQVRHLDVISTCLGVTVTPPVFAAWSGTQRARPLIRAHPPEAADQCSWLAGVVVLECRDGPYCCAGGV